MNRANNAFDEIINSTRYNGQIQSIAWLTSIVDGWFVRIISFCGFFIISIVFLKCALMGLYCSYPKLFDQIHDIKDSCRKARGGGNPSGTAIWALSWLIPDVKSFVDLGDDFDSTKGFATQNIKTILMKTMISGAVFIMVGTAIYNGYYRDFMGKLSQLGGHVFDTYILNLDLADMFDETVNAGKDYKFGFASNRQGTAQNAFAKAIYDDVRNYYGHSYLNTESDRSKVGQNIETWVTSSEVFGMSTGGVGGTTIIEDLFGNENINLAYDITHVEDKINTTKTTADSSRFETTIWKQISDFGHQSTEEGLTDTGWLRITITATPKSAKSSEARYIEAAGGLRVETFVNKVKQNDKVVYSMWIPGPEDIASTMPQSFAISGVTYYKTDENKDNFYLYKSLAVDTDNVKSGSFDTTLAYKNVTVSKITLSIYDKTIDKPGEVGIKLYLGSSEMTGKKWSDIYNAAVEKYKSASTAPNSSSSSDDKSKSEDSTEKSSTSKGANAIG